MSVTTGVVRASFAHVYQPVTPMDGGDPKYAITLLIPKNDTATINALNAEIEQVKQANAQQFGGQIAGLKGPLYDGDGVMPSGTPWGEECRGHMVLRASSKEQPAIVGTDIQPILTPNAVYSGCYIRASVDFYTYNKPMNKGVGCGLNAIQKIEDGEPLANRITPEEAFGGKNAFTSNQNQLQQPAYQQPIPQMQQPIPQMQQPAYQQPIPQMQQPAYQQPIPQMQQPAYPGE